MQNLLIMSQPIQATHPKTTPLPHQNSVPFLQRLREGIFGKSTENSPQPKREEVTHPCFQQIQSLNDEALAERLDEIQKSIRLTEQALIWNSKQSQQKKTSLLGKPGYIETLRTLGQLKGYEEILIQENNRRVVGDPISPDEIYEALADIESDNNLYLHKNR